jgi:signal peptidase I
VRILLVTLLVGLVLAYLVSVRTFRIPSDAMMPTLLDGDFILVNQASYALRLPFTRLRLLTLGAPQRGDVVVFRYPKDPSIFYIKRLVGLPGDHIEVRNDRITVNGNPVPFDIVGTYNDGCYINMQRAQEHLGTHVHDVLVCPVQLDFLATPPASCNRRGSRGYVCDAASGKAVLFGGAMVTDVLVPPGKYFVVGDNRDNSDDSRFWGFVPEDNLVGKPVLIWMSWNVASTGGPRGSRSWKRIE